MRLTEHFDLDEFTVSQAASRHGLDNTPGIEASKALLRLCARVLEPLREALGPVLISSGYRSPEVNAAVGGAHNSQHTKGEAADFRVAGRSLNEVMDWLYRHGDYDQIIMEFPPHGWVHASWSKRQQRRDALMTTMGDGGGPYCSLWRPLEIRA